MPDKFICGKCGKVAKTKQALERHAAYHEDDRPFSCEVCLQRFKNSDDRGKHYRRLKKDGKFPIACTVCHKHFKTNEILKKHVEMLGCIVAEVDVTTDHNAENIDKTVSEDSAIAPKEEFVPGEGINCTCKVCETEFVSTAALKKHYKEVHNDNKRQVCIQCGQTLSSKDSLARHFSIFHQTSFPYTCEICNQKFKIKESMCRHVKFVHQDGGYQCPECHRLFSQPVNLKKHLAVHSTQKNFTCKSCGREFRWKQALQKHILLHEMQGSGNKADDTLNTTSRFRNNSDNSVNDSDEIPNDTSILFRNYEDNAAENKMCENTENERIQNDKMPEKLCTEAELVSESLHIVSNGEYSNKTSRNMNTFSPSGDTEFEDSMRKTKHMIYKKGDEYDFPDKADDLKRISSNTNEYDSCRKRTSMAAISSSQDKKKLKVVDDSLSENRDRSSSAEETFRNANELIALTEVTELDKRNRKVVLLKDLPPLDKSSNVSESFDNKTDTDCKAKDMCGSGYDRVKHESVQSVINQESNIGRQKLTYSALTSFPTDKTKDAPKLVFKPSSIQNIMAGPEQLPTNSDKFADEKSKDESSHINRKPVFKFPAAYGSLHKKIHNPFIIPNNSLRNSAIGSSKVDSGKEKDEPIAKNIQEKSTSVTAPPEQIIPHGKFSLVKHMLSLQNEDNFDKTIFENPLYNKPADIKDFELMVERHRVTDKSDDSIVQSYDLSAKQNIPFNWLGMSTAKRKMSQKDVTDKNVNERNDSERTDKMNEEQKEKQTDKIDKKKIDSSNMPTGKECGGNSNRIENINSSEKTSEQTAHENSKTSSNGQIQRGFQAMKNLVANRQSAHKNDTGHQSRVGKSVLTNPFDYENEHYQDKATDLSRNNDWTLTLEVPRHGHIRSNVHSAEKTKTNVRTEEELEHMFNLNRAADEDIFHKESSFNKQNYYSRQHSVEKYSKSSLSVHSNQNHLTRSDLGSSIAPSSVTNSQFSRSFSIPCTSDFVTPVLQHRSWGSEPDIQSEGCLMNTVNKLQTCHTHVNSAQTLPFFTNKNYEKGLHSQNEETRLNEIPVANCKDETESPTGTTSLRQVDLMMINKNLAQLQKMNQERLNGNTFSRFLKHDNTKEDRTKSQSDLYHMPVYSTIPSEVHRSNFSYIPVNQKVTNDLDVGTSFDAYNFIHSPYRTNVSENTDASEVGTIQGSNTSSFSLEKPHMYTGIDKNNISADFGRKNVSVLEDERRNQDVERKYTCQHHSDKKMEVSIFDILKGHDEKVKDLENIETLLGSYT